MVLSKKGIHSCSSLLGGSFSSLVGKNIKFWRGEGNIKAVGKNITLKKVRGSNITLPIIVRLLGSISSGGRRRKFWGRKAICRELYSPLKRNIKTYSNLYVTYSNLYVTDQLSLDSHTPESDLDLVDDDSIGLVTSNLVPNDQLKKKQEHYRNIWKKDIWRWRGAGNVPMFLRQ